MYKFQNHEKQTNVPFEILILFLFWNDFAKFIGKYKFCLLLKCLNFFTQIIRNWSPSSGNIKGTPNPIYDLTTFSILELVRNTALVGLITFNKSFKIYAQG
jgi:hypothetical protein